MSFVNRHQDGQPLVYFLSNPNAIEEKLYSFSSLPKGWHYGAGVAPSLDEIMFAVWCVGELRSAGATDLEVFPAVNGSILVSAYKSSSCVDVTISESGLIDYVFESNDVEIDAANCVPFSDLMQKIREDWWQACTLSDLSIQSTIVTGNVGLPHWHSMTLTGRAYRWFANAALKDAA